MVSIGIDIGGTGIQIGVVSEEGKIIAKGGITTNHADGYAKQIQDMAACALETLEKSGYTLDQVKHVGVGVPGLADRDGVVIFCTNLGWHDVPFRTEFQKYIDKPVYIDNDATVAGLAESAAGVSAGTSSSIFLTLGTGVGGAIILDGKVWRGHHGVASEIGHQILVVDGELCSCGNRGCLERYCSATAIIRMAREMVKDHPESAVMTKCGGNPEKINAKIVFDAAKEGDAVGGEVFRKYVKYLGQAIANIVNFMDPEVIVLGGGVSKAGDFLLNALHEEIHKYTLYKTLPFGEVKIATLGADAGIIGAAMLTE